MIGPFNFSILVNKRNTDRVCGIVNASQVQVVGIGEEQLYQERPRMWWPVAVIRVQCSTLTEVIRIVERISAQGITAVYQE